MELDDIVKELDRNKKIKIQTDKFPEKSIGRKVIIFTVGGSHKYHREAFHTSRIISGFEGDIKSLLLRLPTIKYEEYNDLSRYISERIPDNYTLVKDGRGMSKSIDGHYTPHILSKNVKDKKKMMDTIDNSSEYFF